MALVTIALRFAALALWLSACGASTTPDDAASLSDAGTPNGPCGFIMPNPTSAGLPNAAAYTANSDGTVGDEVTGLTWAAPASGSYTQAQAATFCASRAGGWRLPTRLELVSLVDFTVAPPGPTINRIFGGTPAQAFWTSSTYAGAAGNGWYVSFYNGETNSIDANNAYRARCVRTAPARCSPIGAEVQAGGFVHDVATGLTWEQTVNASPAFSDAAAAYCAGLGAGWRLPSLNELQTIVDDTKVSPAIDGALFPSTPAAAFLTSSAYVVRAGFGGFWSVNFSFGGSASYSIVPAPWQVRCVH